MINISELPTSWVTIPLHTITSKITDGSHNPPKAIPDGGFPMISARNVHNNHIYFDEIRRISKEDFAKEFQRANVEANDVLLTIVGTIGRSAVVKEGHKKFTLQRSVALIKPLINPFYLSYYFQTPVFQNQLVDKAKGTAQKGVYLTTLSQLSVNVAPIAEQKRIVAKIEELISELDNGIDNLKQAQKQLKTYRQAVLKHAFNGKLTEEWRLLYPQPTAEELLEQIKAERDRQYQEQLEAWKKSQSVTPLFGGGFSKPVSKPKRPADLPPLTEAELAELPELPYNWSWVKLGEISYTIQIGPFGTQLHKEDYVENAIPLINPSHINELKIIPNRKLTVSEEKYAELTNYVLQENDIIMGRRGEMGRCAMVTEKEKGWLCGTGSLFIRLTKIVNAYFYVWELSSQRIKTYLETACIGTTMNNLNLAILNNLPVPLCSINEANQILSEIESRLSVCDKLEETIEKSLKQSEALRQSILKQAFEGKLVQQDPTDEPAAVLIERIKAEKAKAQTIKKQVDQLDIFLEN